MLIHKQKSSSFQHTTAIIRIKYMNIKTVLLMISTQNIAMSWAKTLETRRETESEKKSS